MREVSQELRGQQPVVIWGAGGIGKRRWRQRSPTARAGVLWLDCRGGPAFDTLLDRIGAFCGVVDMQEIEPAIEFYQNALGTMERVGDIHGMASTWANIALLHLQTDRPDDAKPLLARAYLVFAQIGSPNAETAAQALVQACGSVETANAYLAQMVEDEASEATPLAQEEEGITLEQLLGYVAQACRGDTELGQKLWPLVQELAANEGQPPETRALGQVLTLIVAGEREPDLSALPPELAQAVQEMLDSL